MYNLCRGIGIHYIESFEPGEKVAFDIIGPWKEEYIITAIDYFSRYAFSKAIKSREAVKVETFLKEVHQKIGIKMLISDGAKENVSLLLKTWAKREGIVCHVTTLYHHQSNGRMERLNRAIGEEIMKLESKRTMRQNIKRVVEAYNNSWHSAIGMRPVEVLDAKNWNKAKR